MANIGRFKMNDFLNECENKIAKVHKLLKEKPEWIKRFAEYAQSINNNLEKIKSKKQEFHEWAPLYLYMNVSEAKGQMVFSLRYLGQNVATLNVANKKITISTINFENKNKRDFGCNVKLNDSDWRSKEASDFRSHFSRNPIRSGNSHKGNEEHRIESLLLTEFSKKSRKDKMLCNIQPVKLSGIARFQMTTPLTASKIKDIGYSGPYGGGVDILSRIGSGNATKLCIMEVKDENDSKEPPKKAIQQGLAYATFIRELLRSKSGEKWWKIFGFSGKLPDQLELYVACVMPSIDNNDTSFKDIIITIEQDSFHLHYLYFQEKNNSIVDVVTSVKQ